MVLAHLQEHLHIRVPGFQVNRERPIAFSATIMQERSRRQIIGRGLADFQVVQIAGEFLYTNIRYDAI